MKKISKNINELLKNDSMKFMNDFDPELSNRERRKLNRKFYIEGKKSCVTNDNNGIEKDACDCLMEECPGCHFPCPRCRSCKCGSECRVNRKWSFDSIESEERAISF